MKQMKFLGLALVAIFATGILFSSCDNNDDEVNKTPHVKINFNTVTTPMTVTDRLKSAMEAKELAFTSGFITLREIQFEVETDNDSIEVEFELEINTQIDFATGETNPDISFVEIPAGTYNEFEVEIELQDEGDSPSMVLDGAYIDANGTSHPVRFEFNSGETFQIEQEGIIVFTTNTSALTHITIDPTAWFAEVTNEMLTNADKIDGVIVISETQNTDIFEIAADGLDFSSEVEIEID
ncbi:MAG: hypothetical protein C0599_17425 [Salinivirgaceae bacterium]|mgnify:CR=1 FL=1|nr:MAG: hypothetical protein C0599_17425 [Salinivirgaceae bacterium]